MADINTCPHDPGPGLLDDGAKIDRAGSCRAAQQRGSGSRGVRLGMIMAPEARRAARHRCRDDRAVPLATITPGEHLLKPVRQLIESVDDTLNGRLDLEPHGERNIDGVGARVGQRLLALTAAIWHNHVNGQPTTRSLIAHDREPSRTHSSR